jgi:hypothetical protein
MTTSVDPRLGELWRVARLPLLVGAMIVAAGTLIGALADPGARGLLDPAAVDDSGSRAIANLLRDRGVAVEVVRDPAAVRAAGADATVLVPFPFALGPTQLAAVRASGADLVLVAPAAEALAELAPGMELTAQRTPVEVREPACDLPAARAAGAVTLGGESYRGGVGCYPADLGATLASTTVSSSGAPTTRTVTVLGAPDPLTNGALAQEGNAALALRLLGSDPRLLWFLPGPEAAPVGDQRTITELLPRGWVWAAAQLAVAAVLVALWRARRLGPVVREPLPVVVRAAEAVEGRARLYRRAGDRGHAADALRAAARARLAPLVGLPDPAAPEALVDAVGARTGRSAAEVGALLYGPAPGDDADLVALAGRLDACEGEVRGS